MLELLLLAITSIIIVNLIVLIYLFINTIIETIKWVQEDNNREEFNKRMGDLRNAPDNLEGITATFKDTNLQNFSQYISVTRLTGREADIDTFKTYEKYGKPFPYSQTTNKEFILYLKRFNQNLHFYDETNMTYFDLDNYRVLNDNTLWQFIMNFNYNLIELITVLKFYLKVTTKEKNIKLILHEKKGRYQNFLFDNPGILPIWICVIQVYYHLLQNDDFLKFGYNKIVLLEGGFRSKDGTTWITLHHNVLFRNDMQLSDYFQQIKEDIQNLHVSINTESYVSDILETINAKVWDVDNVANTHIKINPNPWEFRTIPINRTKTKNTTIKINNPFNIQKRNYSTNTEKKFNNRDFITPLSNFTKTKTPGPMSVFDIETVEINNNQVPIVITTNEKTFIIDKNLMESNLELAIKNLWELYFTHIIKSKKKKSSNICS